MQNIQKYSYIDALRGLAILGVLAVHCLQHGINPYPDYVNSVISGGRYGVTLFFVVSALTLFMSLEKRSAQEKRPLRNFFIRRFFRIAPLFYTGIIYYLWQDGFGSRYWLGDASGINFWNIISTVTFTHGYNPYWINGIVPGGWTIGVEMTFYLSLPFFYSKIKNLKIAVSMTLAALVGSQVLNFTLSKLPMISCHRLWNEYLYFFFPSQLPIFLLGIILFYMIKNPHGVFHKKKNIDCVAIWLMLLPLIWTGFVMPNVIPHHFCAGAVFIVLGYSLSLKPVKLIVNRGTVFLGRISFSLYLTHWAILNFMEKYQLVDFYVVPVLSFLIRFAILLGLATLISVITYNTIEKPGQSLGWRIIEFMER